MKEIIEAIYEQASYDFQSHFRKFRLGKFQIMNKILLSSL